MLSEWIIADPIADLDSLYHVDRLVEATQQLAKLSLIIDVVGDTWENEPITDITMSSQVLQQVRVHALEESEKVGELEEYTSFLLPAHRNQSSNQLQCSCGSGEHEPEPSIAIESDLQTVKAQELSN